MLSGLCGLCERSDLLCDSDRPSQSDMDFAPTLLGRNQFRPTTLALQVLSALYLSGLRAFARGPISCALRTLRGLSAFARVSLGCNDSGFTSPHDLENSSYAAKSPSLEFFNGFKISARGFGGRCASANSPRQLKEVIQCLVQTLVRS